MHTNNTPSRLLLFLAFALIGCVKANSQVVLNIDYSNLSAVKITATANGVAADYDSAQKFSDGLDLLNFFVSPVTVQDFVNAGPVSTYDTMNSSGLRDAANVNALGSIFNDLSAWNYANPDYWSSYGVTGTGTGVDLTLWSNDGTAQMTFVNGTPFYGEAIFDLSGYAGYTSLFPGLNSTGDVVIHGGTPLLGQWKVVGVSAVPEPSTYAMLLGLATLGAACWHRRRLKHA